MLVKEIIIILDNNHSLIDKKLLVILSIENILLEEIHLHNHKFMLGLLVLQANKIYLLMIVINHNIIIILQKFNIIHITILIM
jgi:hypothetical protein